MFYYQQFFDKKLGKMIVKILVMVVTSLYFTLEGK